MPPGEYRRYAAECLQLAETCTSQSGNEFPPSHPKYLTQPEPNI
jgi:hypothetical protein